MNEKPVYRNTSQFPRAELERRRIENLQHSISIGCCRSLRRRIEEWGVFLADSVDSAVVSEYKAIQRRANTMFQIEELHGAGSLLELSHPTVRRMLSRRSPPWSSNEVAAAERYRNCSTILSSKMDALERTSPLHQ